MVPLPTPDGPASTSSTTLLAGVRSQALRTILGWHEQPLALVAAEPAEPAALADVELFHDAGAPAPCRPRERLEHADDLQLGERVVARALVEELIQAERASLELRLHLGARCRRASAAFSSAA